MDKIDQAIELLTNMVKMGYPVTYATIIDGLCKSRKVDAALEMLKAMEKGNM